MNKKFSLSVILPIGAVCALLLSMIQTPAQGTAFTYQGRLGTNGQPANGSYDLRFTAYDDPAAGTVVAGPVTNSATAVSNGLFTVTIDFGSGVFNGGLRWLQIEARPAGGGAFTALMPRQGLTPSPYAIFAGGASNLLGVLPNGGLGGTYSGSVSFSNPADRFTGAFTGNGAGLTNISVSGINSGGSLTLITNGLAFVLSSAPSAVDKPFSVAPLDLNGDGRVDLVIANFGTNLLTLVTNNGAGRFVFSRNLTVGNSPAGVAAVDINADGRVDLIAANYGGDSVTVLTNNGSGAFVLASTTGTGGGSTPAGLATADVNGDGRIDIITANGGSNNLSILINNGNGTFFPTSVTVGPTPVTVVAVDLNGDGSPDLVSANEGTNTLSVLTNNGNGTFTLASSPTVGANGFFITVADVNHDGKPDLICGSDGANTITVLTNDGDRHGTFTTAATLPLEKNLYSVTTADVNGDGHIDVIGADLGANTVTVFTNNGAASFGIAAVIGTVSPAWISALDVNGDERVDLICPNPFANTVSVLTNSLFSVSAEMTIAGQSGGLRITAGASGVPNIIGGAAANVVESSVNGAVIAGGGAADSPNVVQADFSSIGGGSSNWIGAGAVFAVIGGGNGNTNNAVYGTLGGGFQNFVSGQGATVAGGSQNSASGNYSFIAGGMSNVVSGWYSFAAGQNAFATNDHCFVWSDGSKDAFSSTSFYQFLIQASGGVGINTNDPSGFLLNVAGSVHAADYYGNGATLSGVALTGLPNTFGGDQTVVSGNIILSNGRLGIGTSTPAFSIDVRTSQATERLISTNSGTGSLLVLQNSTAAGNAGAINFNEASGATSGQISYLSSSNLLFTVSRAEQMRINSVGNVGIGITSPTNRLHVLGGATFTSGISAGNQAVVWAPGSAAWSFTSDRNTKEHLSEIDREAVLEKVAKLPLAEWNYIGYPQQRHIGPMAQDFHAAFPLNGSDTTLNEADLHGVELAAIQGLNLKLEAALKEKESRLEKLEQQNAELREAITELKRAFETGAPEF